MTVSQRLRDILGKRLNHVEERRTLPTLPRQTPVPPGVRRKAPVCKVCNQPAVDWDHLLCPFHWERARARGEF